MSTFDYFMHEGHRYMYFMHEGRRYMLMTCGRSAVWRSKLARHYGDVGRTRFTPAHQVRFARSRSQDGHNIEYLMVLWTWRRRAMVIMKTTRPKDFYTEAAAATASLAVNSTRSVTRSN